MKKKSFLSRFLMIALAILAVIATITFVVVEQGFSVGDTVVPNFQVDKLSATYDNDTEWSTISAAEKNSLTWSEKHSPGLCGSSASKTTLYLTYTGDSSEATLEFNYSLTLSGGKCNFNNRSVTTESDTIQFVFTNNVKEFAIYVESGSEDVETEISLTQITLMEDPNKEISLNFNVNENGYIIFNGENITTNTERKIKVSDLINLSAVPNNGFIFSGWLINNEVVSEMENNYTCKLSEDSSITPIFSLINTALFEWNGNVYSDLNDAIYMASNSDSGDKIITLISDGIINSGEEYIFNDGLVLNIPCSFMSSVIYEQSKLFTRDTTAPFKYRSLTITNGTTLRFENYSQLYIGAITYATNGGSTTTNRPVGGYGLISLENNSKIVLSETSELYCFGYVIGEGIVEAESGSIVHEIFQIGDFRGGSAMLGMTRGPAFPFNQYFIQNIESNIYFKFGSKLSVHTALFASSSIYPATVEFLSSDSVGAFVMKSGEIRRKYDPLTDTITYKIIGSCYMNSIQVSLASTSIDSSDFFLPISNNFIVEVCENSDVTVNQDLTFLPQSKLIVGAGATVKISDNRTVFFWDFDSWNGNSFAGTSGNFNTVSYSPTANNGNGGKPNVRTLTESASLEINGTITVGKSSGLFTTKHGTSDSPTKTEVAQIFTSGSGEITFDEKINSATNTTQWKGNSSSTQNITLSLPYLLNNNQHNMYSYFDNKTDESKITDRTIYYDNDLGEWYIGDKIGLKRELTFIDEQNGSKQIILPYETGKEFTFPTEKELDTSFGDFTIKGWMIDTDFYEAGQYVQEMPDFFSGAKAYAVWGGWVTKSGSYYYLDYYGTGFCPLKGLNRVVSRDKSKSCVHYFDETDGSFKWNFNGTYYNQEDKCTYVLKDGIVVEDRGFYSYIGPDDVATRELTYVFITNNNSVLVSGTYEISKENGLLPSGKYSFDSSGAIIKEIPELISNGSPIMNPEKTGIFIDGIRVPYGLFLNTDNYYYYSNNNGELVKNQTFYVEKINEYNMTKGLYHFDAEGRLCDHKTLEPIVEEAA